jgi:hypothetical protein
MEAGAKVNAEKKYVSMPFFERFFAKTVLYVQHARGQITKLLP